MTINQTKKIIYKFAIIFSVFAVFFVVFSFNRCLPDGCSYGNAVCDDSGCSTESISQHMEERSSFLVSITKINPSFLLLLLLSVLFLSAYFSKDSHLIKPDPLIRYARIKDKGNFFNILTQLFSDGILNPKIY